MIISRRKFCLATMATLASLNTKLLWASAVGWEFPSVDSIPDINNTVVDKIKQSPTTYLSMANPSTGELEGILGRQEFDADKFNEVTNEAFNEFKQSNFATAFDKYTEGLGYLTGAKSDETIAGISEKNKDRVRNAYDGFVAAALVTGQFEFAFAGYLTRMNVTEKRADDLHCLGAIAALAMGSYSTFVETFAKSEHPALYGGQAAAIYLTNLHTNYERALELAAEQGVNLPRARDLRTLARTAAKKQAGFIPSELETAFGLVEQVASPNNSLVTNLELALESFVGYRAEIRNSVSSGPFWGPPAPDAKESEGGEGGSDGGGGDGGGDGGGNSGRT